MSNISSENPEKLIKNRKLLGFCLFFLAVSFQVFAFLEVPFLTTIHGYTIGLLFGFLNPFFYGYIIFISLRMMTDNQIDWPKKIKKPNLKYWLLFIYINLICSSLGYYQIHSDSGWFTIGASNLSSFNKWYSEFISKQNAWFPVNTNGGFLGAAFYSLLSSALTGIGTFFVVLISFFFVGSYIFTNSFVKIFKLKRRNKIANKKSQEEKKVINSKPDNSPFVDPFAK